ncbi:uncharacterized protein Dmoj_GI26309 [Drosophila mojavensis]|uniref:Uncharacterized protein n=1 Tax=Drosophila mojavensis TaxID=7230 RepID=A0A0Q9XFK8_DROMO|nr:uncharacterized protein Dmoj_GI26309 [Drosophila mojavensis]
MGCECTLECKIKFFCIWIIVTGLAATLLLSWTVPYAKQETNSETMWWCVFLLVLAAIEVVGGLLMFVAFYKNIAWMFMVGLVLSSFYPYVVFGLVVLMDAMIYRVYKQEPGSIYDICRMGKGSWQVAWKETVVRWGGIPPLICADSTRFRAGF